ncbi:MAG: nucleoside phosphorylase [Chloroflexota bacterium]
MADDVQHHVALRPGDVGRYVLLPGDPGRCERMARRFDDPRLVARNREYETWTGTLNGVPVSVTSTGIGCPSAAIAVEELVRCGADTFIRVGTAGGMQPGMQTGELAIVTAAIRDEGTTSHYLPMEFPALADLDVVLALREAARRTGARAREGVSQSKDSFYGELEPGRMPIAPNLHERWGAFIAGGAICSEMEAAAIFIIASILRVRASGIMACVGNPAMSEAEATASMATFSLDPVIDTAVEALRVLIERDRGSDAPEAGAPARA